MKMLGAKVVPATSGSKTLKDAVNEALRIGLTMLLPRITSSEV